MRIKSAEAFYATLSSLEEEQGGRGWDMIWSSVQPSGLSSPQKLLPQYILSSFWCHRLSLVIFPPTKHLTSCGVLCVDTIRTVKHIAQHNEDKNDCSGDSNLLCIGSCPSCPLTGRKLGENNPSETACRKWLQTGEGWWWERKLTTREPQLCLWKRDQDTPGQLVLPIGL